MAAGTIQKNMVLLWENPNPSASFAAQTVAVDCSAYDYLIIRFIVNSSSTNGGNYVCLKGKGNYLGFVSYPNGRYRWATVSDTSVVFTQGYLQSGDLDNSQVIPTEIYGIKA